MIFRFDHVWKTKIEKLEKAHNKLVEVFDRYKEKTVKLAMQSHTPQNYKEKCEEMEERIEALEKKTTMFR
jgi:Tfp pilus assembly protein PilO|tara:strand:+ start:376 stop:585 length:210 start_codon:yes stop_codon:yes gene_type:complete